ncbi:TonB-dependent receptor plug domain-containing protein [Seonamhaeicola sp. ML3]|uniref:TonB-dependent receptor plug domain-containing protein n=1 Tax=Seonamhaeicola sp. ML3 TaxID=2937786 RepID=UPI00200F315C|nr:TonB-dependent receptor plug domain-containing protein [Seonamhaeicola sp. ML3]
MTFSKLPKIYTLLLLVCALVSFSTFKTDVASVEKIYTQTDRPFYFPGETIWFKSYITDTDHSISTLSDIMNAELISPKGVILRKIRLYVENGYAYGDFDIQNNWVGGIYTLKMYTNWMRNYGEASFFSKKITVQKIVKPNVLLKLKFEKEGYGKGSTVIANFEAKDLKNQPLKNKTLTFEVAVKGKNIISETIVTNTLGKAFPKFILPKDLETSDVTLNVLVPHKGTTESISRAVPVVLDHIDLQFFPESGKIIAGTENKIAFKALNEFGKPVDISGDIYDNNDNVVSPFKSFHDGMGAFDLNVNSNASYYAKITSPFKSEKNIELPKVYSNGTRFSVKVDSLNTVIQLFSTEKEQLFLEIRNASKTLLKKPISNNKMFILNTKDYPIGISKFTILNAKNNILAERLVFLNPHKKLNIDITLNKEIYNTREKVKATITTTDFNNNPIPSNLSLSIADNKLLTVADDKQDHILSGLLLSSELKGKIHKPAFYFNPKEAKSFRALDYIMLTHGWRDYINTSELTYENAEYKPEQNDMHYGTVVTKKGKPVEATLLLFDNKGNKVLVFKTNKNGEFHFKSKQNTTSTLLAYTDDGQKLEIKKGYIKYRPKPNTLESENTPFKENPRLINKTPQQKPIKKKVNANVALDDDTDALDEVVVVGYGTSNKASVVGAISYIKTKDILSSQNDIAQVLQGQVPGVTVTQNSTVPGSASNIRIRGNATISGNSTPLYVVDGVPQEEINISNIHPSQIRNITVLKDASATAVYGCRGANGVIVITTTADGGLSNWGKKKLKKANFNNYAIANYYTYGPRNTNYKRSFYMPQYESNVLPEERTDFRQTIYWNPIIETDEKGKAEFEFYNSDAITSFKITAEGIGYNGLIGRKEKTFATNKTLNVDFKTPNYMVLNDTVVLPVSITNESKKEVTSVINLKLPKELKLAASYNSEFTIGPDSTITKHIRVIPIEKTKDASIQIEFVTQENVDIIKRKTTVLSPYFPTEVSASGYNSASYTFNINHLVKNSLKAEFNIYTNAIASAMDGVEETMRRPYGCFEQTSSATYPNIMILKYLKASGKSNKKIERKALRYIKDGYQKLISFETKEGGFEWFGRTPPHETLTAFGILEFTEMQDVFDGVDQKMIDRTVKWLLRQKDGNGGFNKSKKGYDTFASSPIDVANAYIVYALSEAQVKADISLEYNTAYKDALESKDTYKMALLALASFNLNKPEKAKIIISKIVENIKAFDYVELPVKNTITRSWGSSKNIETVAFSMLALMKDNQNKKHDELIALGIQHMVGNRKYGRFGSTQSTAMALKALIEYTKMQNKKLVNENDALELTINGTIIREKLHLDEDGKITIPNLNQYIKEGTHTLKVNFTNPEITFPYELKVSYDSYLPDSANQCPVDLETTILDTNYNVGDNVSMTINVTNKKDENLGMVTAIVGVPSGTTPQPWQLKEILEQNKAAFYEIYGNYLVFYWRAFSANETKTIRLDLKADIAGYYTAPASSAYLYYGDEFKTWVKGNTLKIGD